MHMTSSSSATDTEVEVAASCKDERPAASLRSGAGKERWPGEFLETLQDAAKEINITGEFAPEIV